MALTRAQRAMAEDEIERMAMQYKFFVKSKVFYEAVLESTGIKRRMADNIICSLALKGKMTPEFYKNNKGKLTPVLVRSDATQEEFQAYAKEQGGDGTCTVLER